MKKKRVFKILISIVAIFMFVSLTTSLIIADTTSTDDDYKKTSDLTAEDEKDEYQKNYQESLSTDENSYLIKKAEWLNKENGEALITIKASQTAK